MSVKSQVTTKQLSALYHHGVNLRKGSHQFNSRIRDLYLDLIFSFDGNYTVNVNCDIPDGTEPEFKFELISSSDVKVESDALEVNYIKGKRHTVKDITYLNGLFSSKVSIPMAGTYALRMMSNTENLVINSLDFEGYGPVVVYPISTQFQLRSRRHASAAYNNSYFDVENAKYFYREVVINKHQPNTYYTFAFVGGYLGLVLREGEGKSQVNFSIWNGNNKVPSKMNEKTVHPDLVYRNFSHEGKGVHSHFPYPLEEGKKYGLLLKLEYNEEDKGTYYTGHFVDLSNNSGKKKDNVKWIKFGTIRREGKFYTGNGSAGGIRYPTRVGGFIENTGCLNGHLWNRQYQMGNDFVSCDGVEWFSPKKMVYTCKDVRNAGCKFIKKSQYLLVEMGGLCGDNNQEKVKVFNLDDDIKKNVPKWLENLEIA